jgi:hypothetical protein
MTLSEQEPVSCPGQKPETPKWGADEYRLPTSNLLSRLENARSQLQPLVEPQPSQT